MHILFIVSAADPAVNHAIARVCQARIVASQASIAVGGAVYWLEFVKSRAMADT